MTTTAAWLGGHATGASWYAANRLRCAKGDCRRGPLFYVSAPGEHPVLMCEEHWEVATR